MAFDIATAKPINQGFDIATAKPVIKQNEPDPNKIPFPESNMKVNPMALSGFVGIISKGSPEMNTFFGRTFDDIITRPSIDFARGARKGAADVMKPGMAVLKALGLPDELNVLKIAYDENLRQAEALPDSQSPLLSKFLYENLARMPGITAEYLQGGAIIKGAKLGILSGKAVKTLGTMASGIGKTGTLTSKAGKGIGEALIATGSLKKGSAAAVMLTGAAEIGIIDALADVDKGISQAISSGLRGGTIGLGIPVAAKLFQNAGKLGMQFGVFAAKKLLAFANVPQDTAAAYIKNTKMFDLNLLKPTENLRAIKERNAELLIAREQEHSNAIGSIQRRQKSEKELMQETAKENRGNLALAQEKVIEKLNTNASGKTEVLKENLKQKRDVVVHDANVTLNSAITDDLELLKEVRNKRGQEVEDAIDDIVDEKPFVSVPSNSVLKEFDDVITSKKEFIIDDDGIVKSTVSGTNESLASDLTKKRLEIYEHGTYGELTVSYLQQLKRALQQEGYKAQAEFAKSTAESMYSRLSGVINLANILQHANPAIKKQALKIIGNEAAQRIINANKMYKEVVDIHAKAISRFAELDATKKAVPNVNKLITAVRTQNAQVLKELSEVDRLLPEENSVISAARNYLDEMQSLTQSEKQSLSILKQNLRQEMNKVNTEKIRAKNKFDRTITKENAQLRRKQSEELDALYEKKMNDLRELRKQITKEETMLIDISSLKGQTQTGAQVLTSWIAPTTATGVRIAQDIVNSAFAKKFSLFTNDIADFIVTQTAKTAQILITKKTNEMIDKEF